MNDTVRRVLSLVPRDSMSLREILRLCHTCKEMRALITQNHGPIAVDVSLDVQQMIDMCGLSPSRFDTQELTYEVPIRTTRNMLSRLCTFNINYRVLSLSLDFCHEGYQAKLMTSETAGADCHHHVLFGALQSLQHLQRAHIYNVTLSTDLVTAFLPTFTGKELSLVQCGLRMGDDFLNAVGRHPTLALLSLSGNSFVACVGRVNVFGAKLVVLNCSDCVSADVSVLCNGAPPGALVELYWNDNFIPEDHRLVLYAWLSSCASLTTLGLRNTSLCGSDVQALVAALMRMPQLTCVDLACNEFGEDVLAFAALMPPLRQFYLSARRCHHAALGAAWCASRKVARDDRFCMYEELETEDLDIDGDA
jgi:hypothetical protein